jgi:hypothetical protein
MVKIVSDMWFVVWGELVNRKQWWGGGFYVYDARVDLVCFKFHSGTQESSLAEYPSHWIKKEKQARVP